jgi:hypothetical protein
MTILEEAQNVVHGPRREDYDHPKRNFDRICRMWSAILGIEVTPRQHALCMIAVKLARDAHAPKRDNLVDIAGYAATIELLDEEDA